MNGLSDLANNAKGVGVFAIVVAVTLAILQGFQNGGALGGNTTGAYIAVNTFVNAIDDFATWAAVIVLGIVGFWLLRYMSNAR